MIALRASEELRATFTKLIGTTKVPVKWNGLFLVIDNYIVLQGELRSMIFHFDSRKVATDLIDLEVKPEDIHEVTGTAVKNVINMILYVFGKWGAIKGLHVEQNYAQLNQLFSNILQEIFIEPEYTPEHFMFYSEGIRITYEDVVQAALDADTLQAEGEAQGLWHKLVWTREKATVAHEETDLEERQKGRLGHNFYVVGHLCPVCSEKMHMAVYPRGQEFRIDTDNGAVLLARVCACDKCNSFYTPYPGKLISEGDVFAMHFDADRHAYEDYLELLGRTADRVSNCGFNRFADRRAPEEEIAAETAEEETPEEIIGSIDGMDEGEVENLFERMEASFYSDDCVAQTERAVEARRRQLGTYGRRLPWRKKSPAQQEEKPEEGSRSKKEGRSEKGAKAEHDAEKYAAKKVRDEKDFAKTGDAENAKNIGSGNIRGAQNKNNYADDENAKKFGNSAKKYNTENARNTETVHGNSRGTIKASNADDARSVRNNDSRKNVEYSHNINLRENSENSHKPQETATHTQNDGGSIGSGKPRELVTPNRTATASDPLDAVREHYDAKLSVMNRYSDRQLADLKKELQQDDRLPAQERDSYLAKVKEQIYKKREGAYEEKIAECESKPYAAKKKLSELIASDKELDDEHRTPLLEKLKAMMARQGEGEVRNLIAHMPQHMDRAAYNRFREKLKNYEEVDLSPYEKQLNEVRMEAERQDVENLVRHSRKNRREDLVSLIGQLDNGGYSKELVEPYIDKVEERLREVDQKAIDEITDGVNSMSFDEGAQAYEQIENGEFLPELKANALKMLSKRLSKIKTDEVELLVQKLQGEMSRAGLPENERHYFYPARRVLMEQTQPGETDIIDCALATYAGDRGPFEYPIFVADTSRGGTGKEGMVLTEENLYYSTMMSAYVLPVPEIKGVTASSGLLNKGVFAHVKGNKKVKIPHAVENADMDTYASVLDSFIKYLNERPASRKVTYLAKERHEKICCFRCGYVYEGGSVCPKCGYKNNG